VTNTPYGRDVVRAVTDAFRAEGMRVGLYYSLIDWHHPDFTVDGWHPDRDDPAARESNARRDMARYREYLFGQVDELVTGYGPLDILWLDFSYPHWDWGWSKGKGRDDWNAEELVRRIRERQPGILLNDRADVPGDFVTPEQYQPAEPVTKNGRPAVWEACQTLDGSWGYNRDQVPHTLVAGTSGDDPTDFGTGWKSTELLVRLLVDSVSKNGNLLLNVGPNGRGELPAEAIERLEGIGDWMRVHGRSIRGCGASELEPPPDCRYTQRGDRLYLHVFAWPFRHVHLRGLAGRVEYAQLLNDASEVKMLVIGEGEAHSVHPAGPGGDTLTLELPLRRPDVAVPVVELFLG
jgi:alpha-L-fucosidase